MSDDEAGGSLYVLSAVLLTPAQFPSVLGDDYPEACAQLGVEPVADGYGLVLGQDEDGARWTVVVDDVSLVAIAIASWDCGMEYDLSPDERSIVVSLGGWPLALAVSAPGVPDPHDPEQGADGTGRVPLSPPSADVWGPVQRRLGADQVAQQWGEWRERFAAAGAAAAGAAAEAGTSAGAGGAVPSPVGAGEGTAAGAGAATPAGAPAGLHRALAEARAYAQEPPPPGRVRSSFAGEDSRLLRADGPGWSLVARTDDLAFVLLDEAPSTVIPVPREGDTDLPGLLAALDAVAVRPA
ncbi:hypothetical protein [Streptomyces antimicrobicus]|uniref:Integral membrane protein n=1 Tax=Streptomyces antimicrobicus TaxID=2883108 RepID=A0ABS8B1B9_9ACTN|nr:hypothetical protein [Streptomyces antimicrobicus]MCB5178408.1 hypothetical protein [Streptomyces antimicrobicus]